jgi:hypothetical protein
MANIHKDFKIADFFEQEVYYLYRNRLLQHDRYKTFYMTKNVRPEYDVVLMDKFNNQVYIEVKAQKNMILELNEFKKNSSVQTPSGINRSLADYYYFFHTKLDRDTCYNKIMSDTDINYDLYIIPKSDFEDIIYGQIALDNKRKQLQNEIDEEEEKQNPNKETIERLEQEKYDLFLSSKLDDYGKLNQNYPDANGVYKTNTGFGYKLIDRNLDQFKKLSDQIAIKETEKKRLGLKDLKLKCKILDTVNMIDDKLPDPEKWYPDNFNVNTKRENIDVQAVSMPVGYGKYYSDSDSSSSSSSEEEMKNFFKKLTKNIKSQKK